MTARKYLLCLIFLALVLCFLGWVALLLGWRCLSIALFLAANGATMSAVFVVLYMENRNNR